MDKRIERMMQLLSDAYTRIQSVTIQATETNTTAILESLRRIQIVYNTLNDMAGGSKGEEKDGSVPEAE